MCNQKKGLTQIKMQIYFTISWLGYFLQVIGIFVRKKSVQRRLTGRPLRKYLNLVSIAGSMQNGHIALDQRLDYIPHT